MIRVKFVVPEELESASQEMFLNPEKSLPWIFEKYLRMILVRGGYLKKRGGK